MQSLVAAPGSGCSSAALGDLVESSVQVVVERVEGLLHALLVHDRVHELHLVDLFEDLVVGGALEERLNGGHGELGIGLLGLEDGALAAIVELADSLHHAEGLVQRAVVVVIRETVLLQELVLDDRGGLYKKSGKKRDNEISAI